jgi:glycosyltransferase involved in cell wall biosynthesis
MPDPDEALRRVPEARAFAAFAGLRVVYVGRLVPSKSVETLLAAQHALEKDGQPCACLIVGDGPMRDSLEAAARVNGSSITTFVGRQPPELVPALLALANTFVMPSLSEGRGLVVVEAMAQGLPVVASDIDALRELVTDGVNGFLFRPGSASDLAARLTAFAHDPGLHLTMGRSSSDAFRELGLDAAESARRHDTLYSEVSAWRHGPL